MRRSSVSDFTIDGVTFACWIDAANAYVWRSACGLAEAGRDGRAFWARADGRDLGTGFLTLRLAMAAAAKVLRKGRAAA